INREVYGAEREQVLKEAETLASITLNPWSLSDLELIAIGGFSPLTGFMNKNDYTNVVEHLHLDNGLVWSIPITLPVTTAQSQNLNIGSRVALYGED
ncbi:sulfate adenylyltransferase, partial [Staphylococcus aureus]